MDKVTMGWIITILVGGVAGWLAQQVMRSRNSVLFNIILGIVGAVLASFICQHFGFRFGANYWVNYLISGFVGACALIAIGRLVKK